MFCKTAISKIKNFFKQLDGYLSAHITTALMVTTAVKNALDGIAGDLLVNLIPGNMDNVVRDKVVAALEKSIDVLSIVDTCKGYTDIQGKLSCFINEVSKRDPQLQQALLIKLASLLTKELDGNRYKQNVYDAFVQAQYSVAK